jgi:DNA-binding SARP family transcriptional activator/streptogramin lyase
VDFRVLGPLEVEENGRTIQLGPAKERALLALLLLARGRPVSTERLTEAIWADDPPASAAKSIQVYVAHLRRALGGERIATRERGYELLLENGELDLERFEHLVRLAEGAAPERAATLLRDALALVRGTPLAELELETWAAPEAARLQGLVVDASESLIDAELDLGHHRQVVPEVEALSAQHPFREHLLEQLMLALYRSGRQADALTAYRRGVARLRDELGLEPGRALQELEGRILRQDAALDIVPAAVAIRARRRGWRLVTIGAAALLAAAVVAGILVLTAGDSTALASVPPGVAVVDARDGHLVSHLSTAEIAQPVEVVTGDGAFWIWNLRPFSLVRVDPHSGSIVNRIASPFGGDAGWFLPDGKDVWFTGSTAIVRVDEQLARIVDRAPIARPGHGRFGLTWLTRCAGSIWVVDADNNEVLRLDPATAQVRKRIDVANPWAIGCGDGGLWVTSNYAGLSRIDPSTNSLIATAPIPTHLDQVVVAGGFAWTTDEQRGTLYKVDPHGQIEETYETGDGARQISYGGGRIWVANQDVGTVTGVDVTTGDVRTLRFGHPVQSVAAIGERLLVELNEGLTYEDRIDQLHGKVAKLITPIYVFDPPDPGLAANPWAFLVERATCATLLKLADPGRSGTTVVPDLATALPRVSNGGKTYTFTVRSGRRFAPPSGAEVTAASVRESVERALSTKLAEETPGVPFMNDLVGLARFRSGAAPHISGIRVRGASISFTLVAPSPSFGSRLALPFFCTVPIGTPAYPGGIQEVPPPSAGPFYMADRFNGEYMILKRNPYYAGPARAHLDAVGFREGLAPERAVAKVKSGDWDGLLLDDTLVGPDSAVARQARHGSRFRYQVLSDLGISGDPPPRVYALLSTRLGCVETHGTLDLAALCLR